MAHTFTNLLTHIIFSTKDRQPLIDLQNADALYGYIGGIVRNFDGILLAVNGPADHVHLLLKLPATVSLADVVRVVKTNSSRWAHETWPNAPFAWQTGYGAFSVSFSQVPTVGDYIHNQREHHRHVSFQEEFVAFLNRHGIEYDQRYIWE